MCLYVIVPLVRRIFRKQSACLDKPARIWYIIT